MSSPSARFMVALSLLLLAFPLISMSASASSEWTAMFYLDGDNNLEFYSKVEMAEINDSVADTVTLVLKDDADDGDTVLYHVEDGTTTELSPSWLDSEMNMADGDTLYEFVNWTLEEYPSNRTFLTMWDHGGAFTGCCVDDTDGGTLTIAETRTALDDALDEGERIDVIGYAQCLMANTEVAYEMRDVGSYMVASEKVGWAYGSQAISWDMDLIIEYMDTTDDPADVASYVVEEALDLYSFMVYQSHTWSAINLTNMTALMSDLNDFIDAMDEAYDFHHWEIIEAREATESYEGPYGNQYDRIVDLHHYVGHIFNITSIPTALRDAALALMEELNSTIIAEGHHTSTTDADEACGNAHGLSINFPDTENKLWSSYTSITRGPGEFVTDSEWDEWLFTYWDILFVDDDASGPGDGSIGDPYPTIQDAIDAADAGTIVSVMDGTYQEDIVLDVDISLIGNGSTTTELTSDGGTVITVTADGATVGGFMITDAPSGHAGIDVEADDVTISQVNVTENDVGIQIDSSDGCSVTYSDVIGNDVGIEISGSCPSTDIQNVTMLSNDLNMHNDGTSSIDAEYNHWGTVHESSLVATITDWSDDDTLGVVDYSPWYGFRNTTQYTPDMTAPTTTDDHVDGWYNSNVTINLTATDDLSGVRETYYRIDGGDWETGTVVLVHALPDGSSDGNVTVEYRSVDHSGNNGTIINITVKIDATAPELRIWYDTFSDRVRFDVYDEIDGAPEKKRKRSGSRYTFILTDHAGNLVKVKLIYSRSTSSGWSLHKIALTKAKFDGGSWNVFRSGERFAMRALSQARSLQMYEQDVYGSRWSVAAEYDKSESSTDVTVVDGGTTTSTESGMCTCDMFVSGSGTSYLVN